MSIVTTPGALPAEYGWTSVGKLSTILSLTAQDQQSIRVHFGSDTTPSANAEYVVMQSHLPRPVMEPYHEDPTVWIMSDDADIIETTVVANEAVERTVTISPTHGALSSGTVGLAYIKSLDIAVNIVNDTAGLSNKFVPEVIAGGLPPGLTIAPKATDLTMLNITGTPTTAGEYFFTVVVRFDPYWAEAYDLDKGEFARGTYSIKVEAAG